MKSALRTSLLTALLILPVAEAIADGVSVKNGRLDAGPVTELTLTTEQLLTVRTMRVLVLTKKQREILQREAHVSPTVLSVHSLKAAGEGIHVCSEYNFALWFADQKIEVPHAFLVSDEEAMKRADELDEY